MTNDNYLDALIHHKWKRCTESTVPYITRPSDPLVAQYLSRSLLEWLPTSAPWVSMKRTRTDVVFPFKTVPSPGCLPTTRARQNYDPSHEFKGLGSNQSETEGFQKKVL